MIRGNLATRPFYNDRVVRAWLAVATIVLLVIAAYNATEILYYSRSDADLRHQAAADEARASELRSAAASLQQAGDVRQARLTSAAAVEANQLIAQRTFSWTALLARFEEALPADVRITSVRPGPQAGPWRVLVINVVSRSVPAIDTFLQNLEDTGAFSDALSREEHVNELGDLEAAIGVQYSPVAAEVLR